jgi:hypothetical protein
VSLHACTKNCGTLMSGDHHAKHGSVCSTCRREEAQIERRKSKTKLTRASYTLPPTVSKATANRYRKD